MAREYKLEHKILSNEESPSFEMFNEGGQNPILLVCEHASNLIPERLNNLGLSEEQRFSHIAWDLSAKKLALTLSKKLDAVLIAACYSRLVYDCNRSPNAPDAMPFETEVCNVPGNTNLSSEDCAARISEIYQPFQQKISDVITNRNEIVLITVHSFTPVFYGKRRETCIGFICGDDDRITSEMLSLCSDIKLKCGKNEPYGPSDGVLHTVLKHGEANQIPYVMIEVRNDLLATNDSINQISDILVPRLITCLNSIKHSNGGERT